MSAVTETSSAVLPETELPEFPSPSIVESRRLFGPNMFSSRPGVVLEVRCEGKEAAKLAAAWSARVAELAKCAGWPKPEIHSRQHATGLDLFATAPADVLLTATELNEQAWVAAEQGTSIGAKSPVVTALREGADAERRSRGHLAEVFEEAIGRGLSPVFDDSLLTLGSGASGRSWPLAEIPPASSIPWDTLRDIPVTLVTGSNGKTTTVRLVAAMWRTAGRVAGWSCSDGVFVDETTLERGDFAGPAGARAVLRDPRVEAAVLETARGGMLRRGLAVQRATAAIITNVSADHFGEYGVQTLEDLADVKAIVARALAPDGALVLNADDPRLVELAKRLTVPVCWFSTTADNPVTTAHAAAGGDVAVLDNGRIMLHRKARWHDLGGADQMPLTLRGAARHNVVNILGACLLAVATGVPVQSLRATLAKFGATPQDNPGRLEAYRFGGITLLVDFAHNPDGIAALCETARSLPAKRRLLVLGQAGNRDDEQLRALVRAAWNVVPFDRVVVKEMPALLRGRKPGEVPKVLCDELARAGLGKAKVEVAQGELAGVRRAFEWAREGDVLVCPTHVEQEAVQSLVAGLQGSGWKAGMPLPG